MSRLPSQGIDDPNQHDKMQQKPTERVLETIWAEVLRIEHVSVHDQFLSFGGDSFTGVSIINRIRDELGVELPFHSLLSDHSSIRELSCQIDKLRSGAEGQLSYSLDGNG